MIKLLTFYLITALMEILGCFLPYLWLRKGATAWVLVPAAACLATFVWLLSLHPTAAGRIYAAYGGVYISVALCWLWAVDGVRPTITDLVGAAVSLCGAAIIVYGEHGH
jgi:small multidrug resistance family-3 protein